SHEHGSARLDPDTHASSLCAAGTNPSAAMLVRRKSTSVSARSVMLSHWSLMKELVCAPMNRSTSPRAAIVVSTSGRNEPSASAFLSCGFDGVVPARVWHVCHFWEVLGCLD